MTIDGKVLALARAELKKNKLLNENLFEEKLRMVYSVSPAIKVLDEEILSNMRELFAVALSPEKQYQIEEIRLKNLSLQEERRTALIDAGFAENFLDDEYNCHDCRDSGYIKLEMCDCLMEIYKKKQISSLSNLFKLGAETFDSFDLTYYSDNASAETSNPPRKEMEVIYEICIQYARKFGGNSASLFFNGSPGLGKTFLSACIAKVVSENGYSVVYDTASSLFSKFEEAKFTRMDQRDRPLEDANRCLACDLLIIDDLGTELTTSFTITALYEIINTRLITNKKTIVSSNLTIGELRARYSEQIMSRLEGEYQVLTFRGEDIRKIKAEKFFS